MADKLTREQTFIKLGETICDRIRTRTRKGKDIDEKKFKKLSRSYASEKRQGGGIRQRSKKTNPTDLQFTGDMLRDLQVRGSSDEHVTIGWTGSEAEKVRENEKHGRFMSTEKKPISKKDQDYVEKVLSGEIDQNVEEQFDKIFKGKKNTLHLKI